MKTKSRQCSQTMQLKMVLRKITKFMETLENPDHPLLGPNLKGLYLFGLWQYGTKFRNCLFNFVHICSILFVVTEFIDLYQMRKDLLQFLLNFSITVLSVVTISKTIFFISMHSRWTELVHLVKLEEISAMETNDLSTLKIMMEYKFYSRVVTYLYWGLAFGTNIITIMSPALKYLSVSEYREEIANRTQPYPHILSSWVPFDKNEMPGYLVVVVLHICMTSQGAGVIAVYDSNAVAIMTFLKGQAIILRKKCTEIFGEETAISEREVLSRIRECHRHHNYIKNVYEHVNSVLSPVMFIYVLVCSVTICCSVVQLSLGVTMSQKLWVMEYVTAQTFQLFLYCWHSNEVAIETEAITHGIFKSNWWRGNLKQRKLAVLLIGKLDQQYILTAGPFTTLSIPTFIEIIKGSYSFYTLFTQMHENTSA